MCWTLLRGNSCISLHIQNMSRSGNDIGPVSSVRLLYGWRIRGMDEVCMVYIWGGGQSIYMGVDRIEGADYIGED